MNYLKKTSQFTHLQTQDRSACYKIGFFYFFVAEFEETDGSPTVPIKEGNILWDNLFQFNSAYSCFYSLRI